MLLLYSLYLCHVDDEFFNFYAISSSSLSSSSSSVFPFSFTFSSQTLLDCFVIILSFFLYFLHISHFPLLSSHFTLPHPSSPLLITHHLTLSPPILLTTGHYRPLAVWSRSTVWPSTHAPRKAFKIRKTSKSTRKMFLKFSVAAIATTLLYCSVLLFDMIHLPPIFL